MLNALDCFFYIQFNVGILEAVILKLYDTITEAKIQLLSKSIPKESFIGTKFDATILRHFLLFYFSFLILKYKILLNVKYVDCTKYLQF